MNVSRIIVAAGIVLTLAACGGSSTTSTAAPSTAAPSVSAAALVDVGTAGRVCAVLNALAFKGDTGADAISTAASAYNITQAQVVAAIDERCPSLKRLVPAGE